MTAAPPRAPVVPAPSGPFPERTDATTRERRLLRYRATLAAVRVRAALVPATAVRRRQAVQLCGAARLLTALGVRVEVVQPPLPWPRHRPRRLQVASDPGRLTDLAVLTAVPRATAGWTGVADRVLPGAGRHAEAPEAGDAVLCPVLVGYRTAAGPLATPPRSPAEAAAIRGLVVEVRLLPALDLTHSG